MIQISHRPWSPVGVFFLTSQVHKNSQQNFLENWEPQESDKQATAAERGGSLRFKKKTR